MSSLLSDRVTLQILDRPRRCLIDGVAALRLAHSPIAWRLLRTLAEQSEPLTRQALFETVWAARYAPPSSDNTLFVHLSRLRNVLRPFGITLDPWGASGYAINGANLVLDEEEGSSEPLFGPVIGRQDELNELKTHLARGERWITLVGPGGIGKSTIARVLCEDTRAPWIDLRGATSPEAVVARMLQFLGLGAANTFETPSAKRAVSAHDLWILDNLEPMPGLTEWVENVLKMLGTASFVATSRSSLGVGRDQVVAPLPETESRRLLLQLTGPPSHQESLQNGSPSPMVCLWPVSWWPLCWRAPRLYPNLTPWAGCVPC